MSTGEAGAEVRDGLLAIKVSLDNLNHVLLLLLTEMQTARLEEQERQARRQKQDEDMEE